MASAPGSDGVSQRGGTTKHGASSSSHVQPHALRPYRGSSQQQMAILFGASLAIFCIPFIFDAGVLDSFPGGSGISRNLVRYGIGGGYASEYGDDTYAPDDRLDTLAAEIDGDFGVRFNATEFAASLAADEAAGGATELNPTESDFTAEDQETGTVVGDPGDPAAAIQVDTELIGASKGGGNSRVPGETNPDDIFAELGLSDIVGLSRSGGGDEYDEGDEGDGGGDMSSMSGDSGSGDGGSGGGGGASEVEDVADEAPSASAGVRAAADSEQPAKQPISGGSGSKKEKAGPKLSQQQMKGLADELSAGSVDLSDLDDVSGRGGTDETEDGTAKPGDAAAAGALGTSGGSADVIRGRHNLLDLVPAELQKAPLRTKKLSGYEWPATNLTEILGFPDLPPLGMDPQVWRDFRPWRDRGFTMRDIIHTRARKTVLLNEKTEFSHEIFTTVIKSGVPYYLTSEMKTLAHYKVARLLKLLDFILQLHSVGKKHPLPDVYLIWTVLPNPLLRARHLKDLLHAPSGVAPVLSLCKTEHDLDLLYPNMYFRTVGWWTKVTRGLNAAALSMPFHKRKARMWWRGSSGGTWPAARPRVLSVSRWFMKPWADFAFTNMWTSVWRRWRRNQWRVHVPRNAMAIPFGGEKRTPIHAVARYKYTLHLPGSFSGTYSRALQFLLWTGTAIFFYDCPYYEFYYHHLHPWTHYIPVNHENLGERMEWAVKHPKSTERIAQEARAMAKSFLNADFLASYWKQLLDEYARLQRFTVELPDDACTCWRGDQKKPPPYLPKKTKRCPYLCDVIQFV